MGWQDAPVVEEQPPTATPQTRGWQSAPVVDTVADRLERDDVGVGGQALGGFYQGVANLAGAPGDFLHWSGNKMLGMEGGHSPIGSENIASLLKALGAREVMDTEPDSTLEQAFRTGSQVVGESVLPASGILAAGIKGGRYIPAAIEAAAQAAPGRFAAAELGSAAAGGVGRAGAEAAGAGPGGQTLAEIAGSLGPGLAGATLGGTTRLTARGGPEAGRQMRDNIHNLEYNSITPSVDNAAEDGIGQSITQAVDRTPFTGRDVDNARTRTIDESQARVEGLANDIAGPGGATGDPVTTGTAVRTGIENYNARAGATANELYDQLDAYIPPETPVNLDNTMGVLEDMIRIDPDAPAVSGSLNNPNLQGVYDNLLSDLNILDANGNVVDTLKDLPYSAIRGLRSKVGRIIGNPTINPDLPQAEMRRLYSALSDDIKGTAERAGPEAEQAYNAANAFWRQHRTRLDDQLEPLYKKQDAEVIYKAIESGSKRGTQQLRALKEALDPVEWRSMVATVFQRLGRATSGNQLDAAGNDFSFQTFMTNWDRLSTGAKDIMFSGPHQRDINHLVDTLGALKEKSRRGINPSGSAGAGGGLAIGAAGVTSVLTADPTAMLVLVGGLATAKGLGRALTHPGVTRWLAKATELPASRAPNVAMRMIATVEEDDPELADELKQMLSGMGQ